MKRLLRSKIVLTLIALLVVTSSIVVALSGSILHSHARAEDASSNVILQQAWQASPAINTLEFPQPFTEGNGILYQLEGQDLFGFNETTGALYYHRVLSFDESIRNHTLLYYNGNLYITLKDNRVHIFDASNDTSTEKWSVPGITMTIDSNILYTDGSYAVTWANQMLGAYDANTGTLIWQSISGCLTSTGLVVSNSLIFIQNCLRPDRSTGLFAFHTSNGSPAWPTAQSACCQLYVANGMVYAQRGIAGIAAYSVANGSLIWSDLYSTNTMIVIGSVMYISVDTQQSGSNLPMTDIYALNSLTGKGNNGSDYLWHYQIAPTFGFSSSMVLDDGVVYCNRGVSITLLDANSGAFLFQQNLRPSPSIIGSIYALNSMLFVSSFNTYDESYHVDAYSVSGQQPTPSPTPSLNVTVTNSGNHFILSNGKKNAALPLHIHVAYSDGSPVEGALIHLSNTKGSLAVSNPITDSNGNLDAPLPLPPTTLSSQPTDGDFVSEVIATVNGTDYSSGSLTLYHAELINSIGGGTLTQTEAANYQRDLLIKYETDPGSPCPDGSDVFCFVANMIDLLGKIFLTNDTYTPQAGDAITSKVYSYSATNMTNVYLLYQDVNGYKYVEWNEDELHFAQWVGNVSLNRSALLAKFASPVTVLAVSPTGQRAGYDPATHSEVFDFPVAISNVGDEPYELMIPNPNQGQYTYKVTGTGNGTYTMTIQSLDNAGNGGSITTIHGVAATSVTDTYLVTYSASPGQPTVVVRQVTIDIKPGEDPPAINPNSSGVIPVAILSTSTFDATKVSLSSVRFGSANAHAVDKQLVIQDVNGDGLPDVVFHFVTNQTGIKAGDTQACLSGQTTSSVNITGCDVIRTVASGS